MEVTEESPLWLTGRAKRLDQVGKGRQAKSRFVNLPMGAKELAKTARYSHTVFHMFFKKCRELKFDMIFVLPIATSHPMNLGLTSVQG